MFEANYLTTLMSPNYEKAIDTPEDILDRGLTVISPPWTESTVNELRNSPFFLTRTLAERTVVAKVIFSDLLKNFILIINFPERIGINLIGFLKTRLLMAPLLLNVPLCSILS